MDNYHLRRQNILSDSPEDSYPEYSQRVPQVGLYPEDSVDGCESSLYGMDGSIQQPPAYRLGSKKTSDDKFTLLDNPCTDSGVGLDSGFDSLCQSSGLVSSGSVSHRISLPPSSTDVIEKQIKHLNIQDQQDSLLRESSVIKSFLSESYASGSEGLRSLPTHEELTEAAVLKEISGDITYSPRQIYWHEVFQSDEDGDT